MDLLSSCIASFVALLISLPCFIVAQTGDNITDITTAKTISIFLTSTINSTEPLKPSSLSSDHDAEFPPWSSNDILIRALIVAACVSVIAIVYMLVRCLRQKHQMSKGRKYGLIATSHDDKLEMEPLDSENEEEDDHTIFDRSSAVPFTTPGTIQATRTANQINRLKNGLKMMKDKAP